MMTNIFSEATDSTPDLQGASESPIKNPNPVKDPVSGNDATSSLNNDELDIGTKSGQNAAGDSTRAQLENNKNKPPIRHVDQE